MGWHFKGGKGPAKAVKPERRRRWEWPLKA
jgi:hypothetical protein